MQILRYDECDCVDTALWFLRLYRFCTMGCATVQVLRYWLCDCADTTLRVV